MKWCPHCRKWKDKVNFYPSKMTRDGVYGYCIPCTSLRRKEIVGTFNISTDLTVTINSNLKRSLQRKYGISCDEFVAKLKKQVGRCAICRKVLKTGIRFAVDHDHKTKMTRGILCYRCNIFVGILENQPALLENILKYLEEY